MLLKLFRISLISTFLLFCTLSAYAVDANLLLEKGRTAIENGQYEEAVNYLGEILTASGNQSTDPKVTALGYTVQAYGVHRMNNPRLAPVVKRYLNEAIASDPEWEFPRKLLKEIEK